MLAIQCQGIKKSYGSGDNRVEVLKSVDLEVYMGQLTLLVGPSGSGKTTLLSIISAILTPDDGRVLLLERDIGAMSTYEKSHFCLHHLGLVFQSFFLIPTLNVVENISLPLVIAGQTRPVAEQKALELLEKMHLASRAYSLPSILSKGQQQRIAIARAMINQSRILICDEPTSSLDQTAGLEVMHLLRDTVLTPERAILIVTHDHRLYPFADRIIAINDGQIVAHV